MSDMWSATIIDACIEGSYSKCDREVISRLKYICPQATRETAFRYLVGDFSGQIIHTEWIFNRSRQCIFRMPEMHIPESSFTHDL